MKIQLLSVLALTSSVAFGERIITQSAPFYIMNVPVMVGDTLNSLAFDAGSAMLWTYDPNFATEAIPATRPDALGYPFPPLYNPRTDGGVDLQRQRQFVYGGPSIVRGN